MSGPLLTWVGGKGHLVPLIFPLIMPTLALPGAAYSEPFAGSAAVYFALRAADYVGPALMADANAVLRCAYLSVKVRPDEVVDELRALQRRLVRGDTNYYGIRDELNEYLQAEKYDVELAARFLLVNRLGFNGLWRVNKRGLCNVPPGSAAKKGLWSETVDLIVTRIRETWPAVASAGWITSDWADLFGTYARHPLPLAIYMDPPYLNTFTGYTPGKFDEAETLRLVRAAEGLRLASGSVIVMSNSVDAEPLLGDGWEVQYVTRSGAVNSDPTKRGRVTEILAVRRF